MNNRNNIFHLELFEWWFFYLNQAQYYLISQSHQNRNNIQGEHFHEKFKFLRLFPSSKYVNLTFIYCYLIVAHSLNSSCCSVEFSLASIRISPSIYSIYIFLHKKENLLNFNIKLIIINANINNKYKDRSKPIAIL